MECVSVDQKNRDLFLQFHGDAFDQLVELAKPLTHYAHGMVKSRTYIRTLESTFNFKKLELVSEDECDLVDKQDPNFRKDFVEPKDSSKYRNVRIYFDSQEYSFNRFFKKIVRQYDSWEEVLQEVFPKTVVRVFAASDLKGPFVTCYTVIGICYSYFKAFCTSDFELQHPPEKRKQTQMFVREILLGNRENFLKWIKASGQPMALLAVNKGILQSSLVKHYVTVLGIDFDDGDALIANNNKVTLGDLGHVPLPDMPESGTFYVRNESHLLLVRSIGKDIHARRSVSYLQLPANDPRVIQLRLGDDHQKSYYVAS